MSTLTKRLTVAVAGGAALMLAAPLAANAASTTSALAAPVAAGAVKTINVFDGAYYHAVPKTFVQDPTLGTVQVGVVLQSRTDSDGKTYYRGSATLSKVLQTASVQIDRMYTKSLGWTPEFSVYDFMPKNSGSNGAVSNTTAWVDASKSRRLSSLSHVETTIEYSVRFSDGSLRYGIANANSGPVGATSDPVDTGNTDSVGSTIVNHYGNPALGSVKIDAGVRLSRSASVPNNGVVAVQPYATITKRSNAVRVQIDAVDLRQGSLEERTSASSFGWPYNVKSRSSGTGSSAFLSTAITSVTPRIHNPNAFFEAHVFYSVRWADGTLSKGIYATPVSKNSIFFPGMHGF